MCLPKGISQRECLIIIYNFLRHRKGTPEYSKWWEHLCWSSERTSFSVMKWVWMSVCFAPLSYSVQDQVFSVRTTHYYQLLHPLICVWSHLPRNKRHLILAECIWNVFTNKTHKTATSRWRTCEAVVCFESLNKTGSTLLEVNPVWLVGMEMCANTAPYLLKEFYNGKTWSCIILNVFTAVKLCHCKHC